MSSTLSGYILELQDLLDRVPLKEVGDVAEALRQARFNGKQVFLMGNGGSASTADHFACDLGKGTRLEGIPPFRAISLTGALATITALANDEGYENIFSGQLANLVQPEDVVIGISASGNSPNVVKAIQVAKAAGAQTIGFTGFDGGQLGRLVDIHVHIACQSYEQVEDLHLILEHSICTALRLEPGSPMVVGDPQFLATVEVGSR